MNPLPPADKMDKVFSSGLRPSRLEHWRRGLATAALAGVGGMMLAVRLEAVEPPISPAADSQTNGTPALSSSQRKPISCKDRQTLLTEGGNLTATRVRVIEEDLKRDPADEAQWARLLGFYATLSSETNALPFATVYAMIVEANPTSAVVETSGMPLFSQLLMDEACFEVVASKWITVAKRYETNLVVLSRAGMFLTGSPLFDKYAQQGEAFLQKTVALDPHNPSRSLELAERYLEKAKPRFDDPDGDIASACRALACLQAAAQQLPESERARPALRQNLTRAAFWAGEYAQAKTYAQDWLKATAQLEQGPAPATQNQRYTQGADRGDAIHDANMILGEVALSEGKNKEAGGFLIEAGKATNGWTLTSYGPDLALVNDLLDVSERQAVLTFFDECDVFWKTGRDSLAQWRKAVQAGQKPDFGYGFHFRFKRLKP